MNRGTDIFCWWVILSKKIFFLWRFYKWNTNHSFAGDSRNVCTQYENEASRTSLQTILHTRGYISVDKKHCPSVKVITTISSGTYIETVLICRHRWLMSYKPNYESFNKSIIFISHFVMMLFHWDNTDLQTPVTNVINNKILKVLRNQWYL